MLFTDIEGSTRLLKLLGGRYGDVLADHRSLLRTAFAEYGGREMDTQGDAFFVAFARARDAVAAAVAGQRALAAHGWPEGGECRVRMGLHTGEPAVGDEGYHGMGVHRGARICAAGHGGQILLSNTTRELAEDELPAGVALRDLGEQWLKDIDRPERLYDLVVEGLPSEFPPLRTARPAAVEPPARRRRPQVLLVAGALALVAAAVVVAIVLITGGSSNPALPGGEVSADSVGVFRPENGRPTGEIPVGASPSGVAAGFGSVWVSNVDANTVSRIDPVKGVKIQTIPVGNGPDGIAVGGDFVWVANGLDGTVSQISPQTDAVVNRIPVGNGPSAVAADARDLWVANANDGTVTPIDLRTGRPLSPIFVAGQSADGVAVGAGSVWVTSESTGSLTRIDARTRRVVTSVVAGSSANAVAVGRDAVWVANDLDGTVTRVDPDSNRVHITIPVGDGPSSIVVTPSAVWVGNELSGSLSKIDPVTNTVVKIVKTGNRPEGIALDAGALFVAVRASGSGHRGGTLRVLTPGADLVHVDPALAYYGPEQQVVILTNDGLTGLRRAGGSAGARLVPDLAVSLPTPTNGRRSYTFQLRPGIRYSTGALVRPQDFRRAIERSIALASPEASYYAVIAGARRCLAAPKKPCDLSQGIVADATASTVTFNLTSPDPDFLYKLAIPSAYAVPAGTPLHPRRFVPATGPYEIASFDPKRGIRLVRNPKFREWSRAAQPNGFPDAVVVRFNGSAATHISAVVQGSADLAADLSLSTLSPALLASLRTQHAGQLKVSPWNLTQFLALNTRVAPFNDVRVRRALNFAVDRQRLKDLTVGEGLGQVTCQVLPPDVAGYQRYCPYTAAPHASGAGAWTAPDMERARKLVRSSGTAGQAITVWISPGIGFGARAGRYIVSVLHSLGYHARYQLAADPFSNEDKIHLQAGFSGWYPDYPAPGGFFDATLTCRAYNRVNSENLNFAEFCDPAIDREMTRAGLLQTSDPEAASRLWAKVDRDVTDKAPWVAFANGVVVEVVSSRVGNYQYNPQFGSLLDQLWVR